MRGIRRTFLASLVFLALAPLCHGVVLSGVVTNGDGSFTYFYSVDNTAGTFDIFSFSIEFDIPPVAIDWDQLDTAAGGDVDVPLGDMVDPFDDWEAFEGIAVLGLSAQDFQAIDPLGSGDVLIGQTLGGFAFVSIPLPSSRRRSHPARSLR